MAILSSGGGTIPNQPKEEEQEQHHHVDANGPVQAFPSVLLVAYHYFGSVANTILN
ncbi:hypothetical protein HZ996_05890 [Cryomorphaceae bacterium]|nr:hypothetical protein HZ996_05890 [Cryomorphaceae bacterium]